MPCSFSVALLSHALCFDWVIETEDVSLAKLNDVGVMKLHAFVLVLLVSTHL